MILATTRLQLPSGVTGNPVPPGGILNVPDPISYPAAAPGTNLFYDSTNSSPNTTFVVPTTFDGNSVRALATVTGKVNISDDDDDVNADVDVSTRVVDANIKITGDGTNKVGDPHTFTVTVQRNTNTPGDTSRVPADVGHVDVTLTNVGGATNAVNAGASTCDDAGDNLDAAGQCIVVFTSPTVGTVLGNAVVTGVTFPGTSKTVTRDTDPATPAPTGIGGSDTDAIKAFVDARISISQTGTNKRGDPHTFTVFVEKNDGTGWSAASGVAIASTETGVGDITGGSCGPAGPTDAAGQCTVIVNSSAVGSSTVNASGTVSIGGINIAVATDGPGAFTISNVKTWVDARISIVQSGTNNVNDPHTFTVTVEKNDGTGWLAAAAVAVTSSETGVGAITGGSCGLVPGATDAAGQCTVVVNSNVAGQSTVHASGTVSVGGVNIAVATDGYGAFTVSNVKTWIETGGLITHTNVTCNDVLSGNASNFQIGQINYQNSGGTIGQGINPGKFFYWTKITTTVPNQVVTTSQTKTGTGAALFKIHQNWLRAYSVKTGCEGWQEGIKITPGNPVAASFTIGTPGNYVIGIKYDPKSIVGASVPAPPTVEYTFSTSLGGSTTAKVLLGPG